MSERRSLLLGDAAGSGAAIGCAAHCLLSPSLVAMLPGFASVIASEPAEAVFLAGSLGISGITLMAARRRVHRCWTPVRAFGIAALLLVAVRAMGIFEQPMGRVIVISAACLITAAHCANIRCCRRAAEPGTQSQPRTTPMVTEPTL